MRELFIKSLLAMWVDVICLGLCSEELELSYIGLFDPEAYSSIIHHKALEVSEEYLNCWLVNSNAVVMQTNQSADHDTRCQLPF